MLINIIMVIIDRLLMLLIKHIPHYNTRRHVDCNVVATFGAVRMYSNTNLNGKVFTSGIQYLDLSATPDYPLAFSILFLRNAILVILGYVILPETSQLMVSFYLACTGWVLSLAGGGLFLVSFHHCSNHHQRLYHRSFHRPFHHLTHHLFSLPWLVAFCHHQIL